MMRLAISNIAWQPTESERIYPLIAEAGVSGLEIAPGLAFANAIDPFCPTRAELSHFRRQMDSHRLKLVSMQAILFGASNALLFGDSAARTAFRTGLERAIVLADKLEIPNIVMGSPRNRAIPAEMERAEAERIACDVFRKLGDMAQAAGTRLALEPNPEAYGTNFLTSTKETIAFAGLVDHPAVTLNFDLGAMRMNGEIGRAKDLCRRGALLISHVHVSEPHLSPAPHRQSAFGIIARDLIRHGYSGWFSIEMHRIGEDNRDNIRARVEACSRQLRMAMA